MIDLNREKDMAWEERSLFGPGHRGCAGCPVPTIVRWILRYVGPEAIAVSATGCLEVFSTPYPTTAWGVPWIHVAFANAAAVASGVERALRKLGRKGKVVAFVGDGGTYDIGLQALSGMLERGHNVMYVLYDNEAYMNTGIQRSGGTPRGAWTTTSPPGCERPLGKEEPKKPIVKIAAAHNIPYAATANIAYMADFKRKVQKAASIEGPTFLQVFSPCVPGWRMDPSNTIKIMKLAVETGVFVLYEVENGDLRNLKVTYRPREFKPVEEYLKMQGRFRHVLRDPEKIRMIQEDVDAQLRELGLK